MKNSILTYLIIIIFIGIGILLYTNKTQPPAPIPSTPTEQEKNEGVNEPASPTPAASPAPSAPTSPVASSANSKALTNNMHIVTIKTSLGDIQFETYDADAPKAVNNFITLAEKRFYNGLIFHRIIPGFMIQGGDPKGDGTGGPGYTFEDELNPETESYKEGYKKGVVAMANAGPSTNGSQFFIMLENYPLPNNYTIFGKVVKGQGVVDTIGKLKTEQNDRPIKPIKMDSVTVEEK